MFYLFVLRQGLAMYVFQADLELPSLFKCWDYWLEFFFFFLVGLGLTLAKQVLYCLGHTSSPFCSGYFGDGISHELFAWAGLKPRSSQSQPPKKLGLQS
jgi:hypothetical protein